MKPGLQASSTCLCPRMTVLARKEARKSQIPPISKLLLYLALPGTGSHVLAQAGLKSKQCWDYGPLCLELIY